MMTLEIPEFRGMDTSMPRGYSLEPTEVYNLTPDPKGGYKPWGRTASLGFLVPGTLIGYDQLGLSAWNSGNFFQLFNGSALTSGSPVPPTGANTHIPGVGVYNRHNHFYIRDANGIPRSPDIRVPTWGGLEGGHLKAGTKYELTFVHVTNTQAGLMALGVTVGTWQTTSGGTFRSVRFNSGPLPPNSFINVYIAEGPPIDSTDPGPNPYGPSFFAGTMDANDTLTITTMPVGVMLGDSSGWTTMAFRTSFAAYHNGRVWGVLSNIKEHYKFKPGYGQDAAFLKILSSTAVNAPFMIGYSDIGIGVGYINIMGSHSYFTVSPRNSSEITGMLAASAEFSQTGVPGGVLLVFLDNETFMVMGDPDTNSMVVAPYPAVVGLDPGVRPASMGGLVLTIWKGRLYVLQSGQASEIGEPIFAKNDPFVQVTVEPANRSILARTQSNKVYRLEIGGDSAFWSRNTHATADVLLPRLQGDTFYKVGAELHRVYRDGVPATPHVYWKGLPLGPKTRLASPRRIRLFTREVYPGENFEGWYKVNYAQPDPNEKTNGLGKLAVFRHNQEIIGVFPVGQLGHSMDLRLEFPGLNSENSIEPPMTIEYVERGMVR